MSDHIDFGAFAIGSALGRGIQARHNELLNALNQHGAPPLEHPFICRYSMLATNGVDLIAHCYSCKNNLRFLLNYTGQTIECIYCKKPVTLALADDMRSGQCIVCNSPFTYLPEVLDQVGNEFIFDDPPLFCGSCGQQCAVGACPYCNQQFYMGHAAVHSEKPECPLCHKKMRLADTPLNLTPIDLTGTPSNGVFRFFEKRGWFS